MEFKLVFLIDSVCMCAPFCSSSMYAGVCQDLPIFIVHPQGSLHKSGMTVTLNCATDISSDTIYWKVNESQVDGAAPAGTLTIISFGDVNQGYYSCVAIRTIQNESFMVSSAEAYIGLPFITSPYDDEQRSVVVDSGDHVVLPCIPEYTSSPAPRATWYYEASPGYYVAGFSKANLAIQGPNGSVVLRLVKKEQGYRCQLDNDKIGRNVQFTTKVMLSGNTVATSDVMIVPPEDALVNVGDSLQLYCITTNT